MEKILFEILGNLLLPFFVIATLASLVGTTGAGIMATLAEGLQIILVAVFTASIKLLEAFIIALPRLLVWTARVAARLSVLAVKTVVLITAYVNRNKTV